MTRALPPALGEHLAGGELTLATCWRIDLRDGTVLGFTSHDRDITHDGVVYEAATGFVPSAMETTGSLEVSSARVSGIIDSTRIDPEHLRGGRYRGAEVRSFRINWADPGSGIVKGMRGTIGQVHVTDRGWVAEIVGLTKALQQELVRVYSTRCLATLGDAECNVDLGSFTEAGTVGTVLSEFAFGHDLGHVEHHSTGGLLTWTSGLNDGQQGEVRYDAGDTFEMFLPPLRPVLTGDTFSVTAGCDGRATTCVEKFDNFVNFRGHGLQMPGEDELFWYPDEPA